MPEQLTYQEFKEYIKNSSVPAARARVSNNHQNIGGPAKIWFLINENGDLMSSFFPYYREDEHCSYSSDKWQDYEGFFEVVEPYPRPEPYKVGDKVSITENGKKYIRSIPCEERLREKNLEDVFEIKDVLKREDGTYYHVGKFYLHQFWVEAPYQPTEEEKLVAEIKELKEKTKILEKKLSKLI